MGLFLKAQQCVPSSWTTRTEIVQGYFSKKNENMISKKGSGFCKARTRGGQESPLGAIFKKNIENIHFLAHVGPNFESKDVARKTQGTENVEIPK